MIDLNELRDRAATFGSDYLTDEEWVEVIDRLEAAERNLNCCQGERMEAAALFLSVKTRLTEERDALRAEIKAIGAVAAPADEPTAPTYSYSIEDELYNGEFDSPDTSAAEAFYDYPELEAVSIGENRKHTAHRYVSADRILEDVTERAYDECGEASEDWLDGVMHNVDLKAELERLVGDWLQAQEPPNFWRVANTRQITRAEMVAAGKLDSDEA
jgi:hypothetical protein